MNIYELQKISEFLDDESTEPLMVKSLIDNNAEYGKAYYNLQILSSHLKQEFNAEAFLERQTDNLNNFWSKLNQKLEKQEVNLNSVLNLSLGNLPAELENFDLWANLENKLDTASALPAKEEQEKTENNNIQDLNLTELLKTAYLPNSSLKEDNFDDFWHKINTKLNSQYHSELFTEDENFKNLTDKEKFFMGLNQLLDGEFKSASKAQIANNHLLECADCRKLYLAFSKQAQVLKYSFQLTDKEHKNINSIWTNLEQKLFPPEEKVELTKVESY